FVIHFFHFMILRCPRSSIFPYTSLFRSDAELAGVHPTAHLAVSRRVEDPFCRNSDNDAARVEGAVHGDLVDTSGQSTHDRPTSLDRKSTRLNSSHVKISYADFSLIKKKI